MLHIIEGLAVGLMFVLFAGLIDVVLPLPMSYNTMLFVGLALGVLTFSFQRMRDRK